MLQSTLVSASSSIDMCMDATKDIMKESEKWHFEYASFKHAASLEPSMEGNVWKFEYPVEARTDLEFACNNMGPNNDLPEGKEIFWLNSFSPKTTVELTCSSPDLKVTGITVQFFGLESCFANVTDCLDSDPRDLLLFETTAQAHLECDQEAPSSSGFTDYDGSVAVFREHIFNVCNWGTSENLLLLGDKDGEQYVEAQRKYKSFVEYQGTETDDKWSIGYPDYGVDGYKKSCDEYNKHSWFNKGPVDVFWLGIDENVTLTCDKPSENIVGKAVEFYRVGGCFANTGSCFALEPMDLLNDLAKQYGLECRPLDDDIGSDEDGGDQDEGDDGDGEGDLDGEPTDTDTTEEEDAAEDLVPGENADSEDPLPFLMDEDVECMGDSADFVENIPGLKSAVQTFQNTEVISSEESGESLIGHPAEAIDAMKSACELNKGHWAFVVSAHFTCVVEGMVTEAVKVHNFGSCLAKTDDCLAMDTTSLLRAHLHDLGYNCWSDEYAGREGEDAQDGDENAEEDAFNGELDFLDTEFLHFDDDTIESTFLDKTGMSDDDFQCLIDSLMMADPDLDAALKNFALSMEIDDSDNSQMKMIYPHESVEEVRSACDVAGGYFTLIKNKHLVCEENSKRVDVVLKNAADCVADTDVCRKMDPLTMMEDMWNAIGLVCDENSEADEIYEGDTSTMAPTNNDNNIKNPDDHDNSDPEDLIESEAPARNSAFGAEQTKANPSNGGKHTAGIALGLSVVAAIGLFGFFRYRSRRVRDRAAVRQYEMTEMSDLGFSVFT